MEQIDRWPADDILYEPDYQSAYCYVVKLRLAYF